MARFGGAAEEPGKRAGHLPSRDRLYRAYPALSQLPATAQRETTMHPCKRDYAAIALLSILVPLTAMAAEQALPYPQRPITLVIGYPPGGGAEALARVLAKHMGEELKQTVIVDFRPGATGNIGAKLVARAKPDGYTIYLGARPNTIHKAMYPQLDYDFSRELVPIGLAATMPYAITVDNEAPLASVQDIIALAKAYPGAPTCASTGVGSSDHLLCAMFQQETSTDIVHVPYRGGLQAFTDVVGGRVDMRFAPLPSALPHIIAGNLRAVAVMSRDRLPSLPHTPTIAEAGFPKLALDAWYGLMAPAGTPTEVVTRLNQSMNAALANPEMQEALTQLAYVPPPPDTPEAFGALIAEETERWMKVLAQRNLGVDSAASAPAPAAAAADAGPGAAAGAPNLGKH